MIDTKLYLRMELYPQISLRLFAPVHLSTSLFPALIVPNISELKTDQDKNLIIYLFLQLTVG